MHRKGITWATFLRRRHAWYPEAHAEQIVDEFTLHPAQCHLMQARLVDLARQPMPPVPSVIRYRFQYARSPRAAFRYPWATAEVR